MTQIKVKCEECGKETYRSLMRDGSYIGIRCCNLKLMKPIEEDLKDEGEN